MMNTSLHKHKSISQSTSDLWDISVPSRFNSKHTRWCVKPHMRKLFLFHHHAPTNPLNTNTHSWTFAEIFFFFAIKNSKVASASTCCEWHMTSSKAVSDSSSCTPQRSPRLNWCPATTVRAACIHPFLCTQLTAAGTDKVVQQGELTFGLLTEKTWCFALCTGYTIWGSLFSFVI